MADGDAGQIKVGFRVDTTGLNAGMNRAKASMDGLKASTAKATTSLTGLQTNAKTSGDQMSAFQKKAQASGDSINNSLGGMLSSSTALKVGMVAAFAAIGVAAFAAAKKVWDAVVDMARMADKVQDIGEEFDRVYGVLATTQREMAEAFTTRYGANQSDIEQYMLRLQRAFTTAGLSAEEAAKRTEAYLRMAYDVSASYSDINLSEAKNIIETMATGEVSGLKRLVGTVNDITIKQYAAEKGLKSLTGRMTQAEKSAAIYAYTMENLSGSLKPYLSDMEDIDAVTDRFDATLGSLKETLGEVLLPAITQVLDGMTKFFKAIQDFVTWYNDNKGWMDALMGALTPTIPSGLLDRVNRQVSDVSDTLEEGYDYADAYGTGVADAVDKASEALAGLAGFDKLMNLTLPESEEEGTLPVTDITVPDTIAETEDALVGVADSVDEALSEWDRFVRWVSSGWDGFTAGFAPWWDEMAAGIGDWASEVGADWSSFTEGLGAGWDGFMSDVGAGFDDIGRGFDAFCSDVGAGWSSFWGGLSSWWEGLFTGSTGRVAGDIVSSLTSAGSSVMNAFSGVMSGITSNFSSGFTSIGSDISNIMRGVASGISSTFSSVISGIRSSISGISNSLSSFGSGIGQAIGGIANSIGSFLGFAEGGVVDPGHPFLAVVGDNKKEPEVISPISTMKQAFKEALAEAGGAKGSGSQPIVLSIELDGKVLARQIYDPLASEGRRRGVSL